MKLYEIGAEIHNAIELYNHVETDEELKAIEEKLSGLQLSFDDKALGVAKHIKNIEGDISAVSAELDRLKAIQKRLEGQRDWFHGCLFRQMLATNTEKVDGVTMKLAIQKNPPAVIVEDESLIPDKYKRVIPEHKEIDKVAIKEAWKNGVGVAGTKVQQSDRLTIK